MALRPFRLRSTRQPLPSRSSSPSPPPPLGRFRTHDRPVNDRKSDGTRQHWTPWTMRLLFLVIFAIFTILIVLAIEILIHVSGKRGALSFLPANADEEALLTTFSYDYVPVVFALAYGLVWAVADHDFKRLEPFYQLSTPGGAEADDSLLLDYPFMFASFAPIKAFKRRHWAVFCSGSMLVLIMFFATPLASAMISRKEVVRIMSFPISHSALLDPQDQTKDKLTCGFSQLQYQHVRLNATLPRFTDGGYAVLPFTPATATLNPQPQAGEIWTGNSTLYRARLECSPARREETVDPATGFLRAVKFAHSEQGAGPECSYTFKGVHKDSEEGALTLSPYVYKYNGAFLGNRVDLSQNGPLSLGLLPEYSDCLSKPHIVFGLWSKWPFKSRKELEDLLATDRGNTTEPATIPGDARVDLNMENMPYNATGIFCEPIYEQEQVEVTVDAISGQIIQTLSWGTPSNFTGLNLTRFEDIATLGCSDGNYGGEKFPNQKTKFRNIRQFKEDSDLVEQLHARLFSKSGVIRKLNSEGRNLNYFSSTGTVVPFAMNEDTDPEALLDWKNLESAYWQSYAQIFAFALSSELITPAKGDAPTGSASRKFNADAYIVEPLWARLFQAVMVVTGVFNCVLVYISRSRRTNLNGEPSSLATIMASIAGSPSVLADFEDSDLVPLQVTAENLRNSGHRYTLVSVNGTGNRIDVVSADSSPSPALLFKSKCRQFSQRRRPVEREPVWEMERYMGAFVTVCLLGVLAVLTYIYFWGKRNSGLPKPNNSVLLTNICYQYIPTIVAMFVEPFWVLMTRFSSVVMPFEPLYSGKATQEKTLSLTYESSPAHFQIFKAAKAGHILLAALGVAVVLANLLAIALSGMFTVKTSIYSHSDTFELLNLPKLNVTSIEAVTNRGIAPSHDILDFPKENFNITWDYQEWEAWYLDLSRHNYNTSQPPWVSDDLYFIPFRRATHSPTSESYKDDAVTYTAQSWAFGAAASCRHIPTDDVQHINIQWAPVGDDPRNLTSSLYGTRKLPWQEGSLEMYQGQGSQGDLRGIHDLVLTPGDDCTEIRYWGNETAMALRTNPSWLSELYSSGVGYFSQSQAFARYSCRGHWAYHRARFGLREGKVPALSNTTTLKLPEFESVEHVFLSCEGTTRVGKYQVTVDAKGNVLEHVLIKDHSDRADDFIISENFDARGLQFLYQQVMQTMGWNFESMRPAELSWKNFFGQHITGRHPELLVDGNASPQTLLDTWESVYGKIFSYYLYAYAPMLFPLANSDGSAPEELVGTTVRQGARVIVSDPMYWITATVLAAFIVSAVIVYWRQPGRFMSHLPTSLAANLSLIYASKMLDDVYGTEALVPEERRRYLKSQGLTYGYGWFIGRDGKIHYGVDKEPMMRDDDDTELQEWT